MKTGTALAALLVLNVAGALPDLLGGDAAALGVVLGLPILLLTGAVLLGDTMERSLGEALLRRARDAGEDEALHRALVEARWGAPGAGRRPGSGTRTARAAIVAGRRARPAPPRRRAPGAHARPALRLRQG